MRFEGASETITGHGRCFSLCKMFSNNIVKGDIRRTAAQAAQ